MRFVIFITFTYIICAGVLHVCEETDKPNSNESKDVFVPTNEWQVVKKGQPIPQGLHVRINFETGVTEAKLMDANDSGNSALSEVPQKEEASVDDELEDVYKKLTSSHDSEPPKWRSYEEIKTEMDALNLNIKTDFEVMHGLFKRHDKLDRETDNSKQIITILEDLELLVHQIDNANEFVRLDGFKKIVYPSLNISSTEVKCETLKLFGSSLQNNPKVQIHAIETGGIDILLRTIALHNDLSIKSRVVFALGGLLRGFPHAQKMFIEKGGLNVLANVFQKQEFFKIQVKILTLINDLLVEYHSSIDTVLLNAEKARQYKEVALIENLKQQGWCQYISSVFLTGVRVDIDDNDTLEKCLEVVDSTVDICIDVYDATMLDVLTFLHKKYKNNAEYETEDNSYFAKLEALSDKIIGKIRLKYKTEL